jgi:hypothetical protein
MLISGEKNGKKEYSFKEGNTQERVKQGEEIVNNQHETVTQRDRNECKGIELGKTAVTFGG